MTILSFILTDPVHNAVALVSWALLRIDSILLVHLLLQIVCLSRFNRILFLHEQKSLLGHSELIFQDSIDDLHLALFIQYFLAEMLCVALLHVYVEKGWNIMRLPD